MTLLKLSGEDKGQLLLQYTPQTIVSSGGNMVITGHCHSTCMARYITEWTYIQPMVVTFSHYVNYRRKTWRVHWDPQSYPKATTSQQQSEDPKMWKNGDRFMADQDSILYEARLYMGKRDLAGFLGSAFIHLEGIFFLGGGTLRNTVPITFIKKYKCLCYTQ